MPRRGSQSFHIKQAASTNDSTVKHSQDVIDTLFEQVATAQEELAGFFMFKLQIPDSAINHYLTIVSSFKKSRVYPSSLYTLGEYYYSSGDTTNGKNYLTQLITDLPESGFALSARSLLGIKIKINVDSTEVGYDRAMDFENRDVQDSALAVLKGLLEGSKSRHTPQVLYAVGWIYENKLSMPDSAFVYYKKLTTQYASSNYSVELNPMVTAYEQAERDSAAARKRIADSISGASRPVASDSVKGAGAAVRQIQKSDSAETSRDHNMILPQVQKPDSLKGTPQKVNQDSLFIPRKGPGKTKEIEK